jgi:tRNA(adenine34) deaminase
MNRNEFVMAIASFIPHSLKIFKTDTKISDQQQAIKSASVIKEYDRQFMLKCIELSQASVDSGDAAFGSVITIDHKLIAEGANNYRNKISDHAEIVALNNAHQVLGTHDLSSCTLYTSCEPCPMCSFMIREFKIKRVVFCFASIYFGGF